MALALFLITDIGIAQTEQASHMGVAVSFREPAPFGIPVTLVSLIVLVAWGIV